MQARYNLKVNIIMKKLNTKNTQKQCAPTQGYYMPKQNKSGDLKFIVNSVC